MTQYLEVLEVVVEQAWDNPWEPASIPEHRAIGTDDCQPATDMFPFSV